nr:retrotransposon-related protein [Tanacetum cinerariifolium]
MNGLITTWARFEESMRNCFGPSKYEDPNGALSKLLQLGTFKDYQQEFEKLMDWATDIPDSLHIFFYIFRLKLHLQREFLVSRPTTLGDVFSLALITKARLDNQATPVSGTTTKTFYNNGGGESESLGPVTQTKNEEVIESEDTLILNSLFGHRSPQSLQLFCTLGTGKVHILIDNGSTHNFVQPGVVERMKLPVKNTKPFKVYIVVISSDKVKGSGDWNLPKYEDTAVSKGKKVVNTLNFYTMETDEIIERYITSCFVNGLEAYDGEVKLEFDENLVSNEFTVKLCLDYEVKKGKKLVKKELIVALKGDVYFGKFIINPKEDDSEPGVILGRSFLRLAYGVVDFSNWAITIYREPDPFDDDYEKIRKSLDDWDHLLDFNFDDMPKFYEELPPFICKMGKSNRNKKRKMENLNLFYQDIGPSSSAGSHLTQEEVEKEALSVKISQKFALLEEDRSVIETMAYNDKHKKILDEILRDKVELN